MFLCKWRARKQISLHRDNKVVLYCIVFRCLGVGFCSHIHPQTNNDQTVVLFIWVSLPLLCVRFWQWKKKKSSRTVLIPSHFCAQNLLARGEVVHGCLGVRMRSLSLCLSLCLSVSVSVCLSVCLSASPHPFAMDTMVNLLLTPFCAGFHGQSIAHTLFRWIP